MTYSRRKFHFIPGCLNALTSFCLSSVGSHLVIRVRSGHSRLSKARMNCSLAGVMGPFGGSAIMFVNGWNLLTHGY